MFFNHEIILAWSLLAHIHFNATRQFPARIYLTRYPFHQPTLTNCKFTKKLDCHMYQHGLQLVATRVFNFLNYLENANACNKQTHVENACCNSALLAHNAMICVFNLLNSINATECSKRMPKQRVTTCGVAINLSCGLQLDIFD